MARYVKKKELCSVLSVSPATIDRWEAAGKFVKRCRVGNFRVAWSSVAVIQWFRELNPSDPLTFPPDWY
jgi:predicted DNA-binding transcriptional regulator AlpA